MTHTSSFATAVAVASFALPAYGNGLVRSENFIVVSQQQSLAEAALAQAEIFRREVARQWLGEELPPSVGRTVLSVEITNHQESGLSWAVGPASPSKRRYHNIWVKGPREKVLGSALKHEVAHIVLATEFGGRLPAWIDEGIASQYDDEARQETRRRTLRWFVQSGNWPQLSELLRAKTISTNNTAAYSAASSVIDHLLTLAEKETLLAFAKDGIASGWEWALKRHYHIDSIAHLQSDWQSSVDKAMEGAALSFAPSSR